MSWVMCAACNEEWPADAFTAAGSAYGTRSVCSACYLERWPRRSVQCTGCGRRMETRGKSERPSCQPCRRGEPPVTACRTCGGSLRAVRSIGGECERCHKRRYRLQHGRDWRAERRRVA